MQMGDPKRLPMEEAGFSMVEMLMTAFILAIGILGLAMLQTMSLRASGGSRNLNTAVQLAEQMMDQIEQEGRLTYNNKSVETEYSSPTALTGLQFIDKATVAKYYNIDPGTGNVVEAAAPAAGASSPLFKVSMAQTVVAGVGLSDVTVNVQFIDGINQTTQLPITRTATLTRRILHA